MTRAAEEAKQRRSLAWKGIAWRVPLQTGPEGWDLSGERCAVAAWQSWGSLSRHLSTHSFPCPGCLQREAWSRGNGPNPGELLQLCSSKFLRLWGVCTEGWGDGGGLIYYMLDCCPPSLLDLALSSDSLHGLAHCLLIPQELHGLDRLQVLVQLVNDRDTSGQVQLHDGLF